MHTANPTISPRILSFTFLLGCLSSIACAGCEHGFELSGRVNTAAVVTRDRPAVVLLAMDPALDASGQPMITPDTALRVLEQVDRLPPDALAFRHFEHCGFETYAVIAWAGAKAAAPAFAPQAIVRASLFTPEPGDLVATSARMNVECTTRGSQTVELRLSEATVVP